MYSSKVRFIPSFVINHKIFSGYARKIYSAAPHLFHRPFYHRSVLCVGRVCSKCITHVLCFRVCRRWMLNAFAKPILFAVSQFPQPKSQSTPGPLEPLVSYHMRSPNIALVWCWLWLSHICFATHQPSSRFRKDFLNVQFPCKLFLNLNIWPALFFHIKHFTMHLMEPHTHTQHVWEQNTHNVLCKCKWKISSTNAKYHKWNNYIARGIQTKQNELLSFEQSFEI